MKSLLPSPAIAIVGRHNSGKTTLVVALVEELVARGLDVGTIKHHSHPGFEIDVPGKDSYRHRHAGASETIIASPDQLAIVKTLNDEAECADLVARMPGHDVVLVEGYRKSGLPTIEVMRSGNSADVAVAEAFVEAAQQGVSLETDFVQQSRARRFGVRRSDEHANHATDLHEKVPTARTVAVVTDIPAAQQAAQAYGIPAFGIDDIAGIADFLQQRVARPRVSVVIQAGGESKRMGTSKALVSFMGRPLIQHMIERMLPVADELVITTNEAEKLAFLLDEYPQVDIRLVPDVMDRRGALPGLLTALQAATYSYVALVACDMVFASPRLVAAECAEMNVTQADIVVPVNKHGFEPLHAVYRREACLDVVRRSIDQGEARLQSFYHELNVQEFPMSRVLAAEPQGGCFINVNTPEELAAVERLGDSLE